MDRRNIFYVCYNTIHAWHKLFEIESRYYAAKDITLLDLTTEADGWNKTGNEQK